MPPSSRTVSRDQIVDFIRRCVVARLGVAADGLLNDTVLADIGLESIDVVLISGQIEDEFDLEVAPSMMFEYRTIDAVADHLVGLLADR
ncbi:acyl carrier protein [Xylophilus sp. GOD-11R]|uniref:acyl carrier protein n=1 Tax=Xylophilus sp. GOD-11R TaxID=3089814 RepID=UPI00298C845C|nr:acyl carrier protein [Xylophilus sp. GOD-11R]WPB59000.1 acyl carrier protein [Xylophilus sp. GOD-11R]